MANELSIILRGTLANGNLNSQFNPGTVQVTQAAQGLHAPTVSVGTSEEDLDIGDLGASTVGYLFMRNLDTTNYVQWGPKSGGAMVAVGRLKAGEVACLRVEPSVTIRWVANTATCLVQCWFTKA